MEAATRDFTGPEAGQGENGKMGPKFLLTETADEAPLQEVL